MSECPSTDCDDGSNNKKHGYGMYIHKSADAGETWRQLYFQYERSALSLAVLSPDEAFVGGGGVGLQLGGGSIWHTADGGKSWAEEKIGGGYVMGLAGAKDGSGVVYASACVPAASACAYWRYS